MNDCKFCENLQEAKRLRSKKREGNPKRNYHYKLRLYIYSIENRRTCGSITFGMFPINFCPECGKKLTRKSIVRGGDD